MTTYALPRDSLAWQTALDDAGYILPIKHDVDSLAQLPIFAVIVVVDNAVFADQDLSVDDVIQHWVDTQTNWQIKIVHDDEYAKDHAYNISTSEKLADVSVFRYLLLPTQSHEMTPQKRDAATHIIDEQLTAYLKKQLKPINHQTYTLDNAGQVVDFDLNKATNTNHVDVHILSVAQLLRRQKLVCFDMDSTLIEQEVIVELAKMCGISERVYDITERAMRGEIDFAQSFAERVALLAGVDESVVARIIEKHITFQSGAFALIRALKAQGSHTILVSGGFEPFAEYVAKTLGIDEYYANPLMVRDGRLSGQISPVIVDGQRKAQIVSAVAKRLGIDMNEVVCVGDGANDLPMMSISNLGVAYHAKPIVQARADSAVNITGLEGVLYALGHRFDEVANPTF